jgi:5-formaminoimidazole-4-carboxamide-1-beta-D-ribofuranosyl 5'-monophosphate synthetase
MIEKLKGIIGTITTELPEPFNKLVVKTPTAKDRLEAFHDFKRLPYVDDLPDDMRLAEQSKLLAWHMIMEPKVSFEDYLNLDDMVVNVITGKILNWYNSEMQQYMKDLDFLQVRRGSSQTRSTSS